MLKLILLLNLIGFFLIDRGFSEPSVAITSTSISELINQPLTSSLDQKIPLYSTKITPGLKTQSGDKALRFLVQGGLHGNEILTTAFVYWLIERIRLGESPLNSLPSHTEIDFLPSANPDSFGKHRYNSRNVNLNRNFSVLWGVSAEPAGPKPFSESESIAIRELMNKRQYLAAIDIHGYINWVVLPTPPNYLPNSVSEKQKEKYQDWVQTVKNNINLLPGYQIKKAGILGDGGSFEDWAFWENETYAFCLEMTSSQRFFESGHDTEKIRQDSFLVYEAFIAKMFQSALKLDRKYDEKPAQLYASQGDKKALGKQGH